MSRIIVTLILCAATFWLAPNALAAKPSDESVVRKTEGIDLGYCLKAATGKARPDESKCPGFITQRDSGLAEAIQTCRQMGGALKPAPDATIYSLDINGDGQKEFLYEIGANFQCDSSASLFSCGSSDCPWTLYRKEQGKWHNLGAIYGGTRISVVPSAGKSSHPDLKVLCDDTNACDSAAYHWDGARYQQIETSMKGYTIQQLGPPLQGKLITLQRKVKVLAEPRPGSRSVGEYGKGATFVIAGRAKGSDYLYVSPCNACQSGFVQKRVLLGR